MLVPRIFGGNWRYLGTVATAPNECLRGDQPTAYTAAEEACIWA